MADSFLDARALVACGALLVMGSGEILHAQNRPLDRALRQMREVARGNRSPAEEAAEAVPPADYRDAADSAEPAPDDTPLGVDLLSLHLLSHQDEATMSADPGGGAVVIDEELPAPEGLAASLEPFVGQPMSMALLSEIGKEIVLAWRDSEYPLVDVYFPEQNITGGKLQVVVREAVLGSKRTEGAGITREEHLLENLRVEPGDRINQRLLGADIDWLNENPVRQVAMIYEKGEEDGTSDIVLDVTEENPITAYAGFANTGLAFTGEEEWSFGVNWFNPFREEHTLGYHYTTDLEWENLQAHTLFYQTYLPWRHTFRIIGVHVSSDSELPLPTDTRGLSRQLSPEYRIPLPRPGFNRSWKHALAFGFDYKSTNTDLIFGGATFFGTEVQVGQFRAVYEALVPDELGVTRFNAGLIASPGDMFEHNDDASFGATRFGSEADYVYGIAEVERLFRLPGDYSLRFHLRGRVTDDRLTATEEILAGGYSTVRGFDESIIRGDSGIISSVELISPEFSLIPARFRMSSTGPVAHAADPNAPIDPKAPIGAKAPVPPPAALDGWNALVFYDAAAMDVSDALPGEVSPSIQSVGVGLRCRMGDRGFARASYGWQVQSHGLLPADEDGGKFHFGITLTY